MYDEFVQRWTNKKKGAGAMNGVGVEARDAGGGVVCVVEYMQ
jgi:hypothetical protein